MKSLWKSVSMACDSEEENSSSLLRDYAAREFNALLWVSLITITFLLLREVYKVLKLWRQAREIPGPPCPSFFGHSKLISSGSNAQENLTIFLSKSHEKYGSVVKLWLGPTQLLVSIKDPMLIKDLLFKAEDKLPLTGRAFRLAFGPSALFVSSFDKVRVERESLMTELNEKFVERINVNPTRVIDCVIEKIDDMMAKGSLDCKMVSQHMALTMLGATLFGDLFLAWSDAAVYEELLVKIAKDACFWASYSVTPFWKCGFWRYQCLCTKLKCLTQDLIQKCRQNYKLFYLTNQKPHDKRTSIGKEANFDAPLSSAVPDKFLLHELSGHYNACGSIMGVMFHGCLTTAGLIGNILARLVMHPELQDMIYSEIIMVQKKSQNQDQKSVDKMLLLLATIYETARLLPAGPLLQRCSLKHDLNLETGITIPAGTILVVPIQLVQMDDSSWGREANQFNPRRFLSKAKKWSDLVDITSLPGTAGDLMDLGHSSIILKHPNKNAAFLPFGSGTRACVGQKFVFHGVATLFASLLEHYEIRLQPGSESEPKPTMKDCVLQLLPTPKIDFVKRKC